MVVGDNVTTGIGDATWSRASETFSAECRNRNGCSRRRCKNWSTGVLPGPNGTAPSCPVSLSSWAAICTFNSTGMLTTASVINAWQRDVDLVVSLLREVAAAPSQQLNTGINRFEDKAVHGARARVDRVPLTII